MFRNLGGGVLVHELGGEPLALALQCGIDPAALDQQDLPVQGSALARAFRKATGQASQEFRAKRRQARLQR